MKSLLKKLHLFCLNLQLRWVAFRFTRMMISVYDYPTQEALQWITQMRWYACQKEQIPIAKAILESLQNLEYAVKRKAVMIK